MGSRAGNKKRREARIMRLHQEMEKALDASKKAKTESSRLDLEATADDLKAQIKRAKKARSGKRRGMNLFGIRFTSD